MANAVLSGRTADLLAAGTAATAFHLMTMQTDVLVDVAEVRSMGRIRGGVKDAFGKVFAHVYNKTKRQHVCNGWVHLQSSSC